MPLNWGVSKSLATARLVVRWRKMSDVFHNSRETLNRILFVASICLNEAHEDVRGIAKLAVVELEGKW